MGEEAVIEDGGDGPTGLDHEEEDHRWPDVPGADQSKAERENRPGVSEYAEEANLGGAEVAYCPHDRRDEESDDGGRTHEIGEHRLPVDHPAEEVDSTFGHDRAGEYRR